MQVTLANALVKQLANGAREFGRDFLRLVRDVELRNVNGRSVRLRIRLQKARDHANERRLSRAVLSEHHHDLRVGEGSRLDVEREGALRLLHGGVLEHAVTFALRLGVDAVRHLERKRVFAESQVLRGHEARQEDVDAISHVEGHSHDAVRARLSVQAAHKVRKVVEHREVVLDDDDVHLLVEHLPNDARGGEALLDVQVTARLVNHVHVSLLHRDDANGEALQLPSRELVDVAPQHDAQVEVVEELFHEPSLVFLFQGNFHVPLDGAWDVVDVLRFDDSLEVVLKQPREVVLQVTSSEVCEDVRPVGRIVKPAQVWLHFPRENLEGGGLPNAVRSHESKHLSRPWHG
mmetsp:Transcript_8361/g.18958  ORF Transcript_8361/g.18958 Transcript_8361/m.18958 type:complete len:348 (-) Transcript_8361:359-1402(-)